MEITFHPRGAIHADLDDQPPAGLARQAALGQRIRMTQAAKIKERLSDELGRSGTFPAPAVLAQLTAPQRGLTDRKIGRPYRAWVALLLRAWREAETGEIGRGRRSTTRLQPPDAT